eukprot:PhM_4_TR13049/c0_g1_i1/m.82626
MSFRTNVLVTLVVLFLDMFLHSVRPTWTLGEPLSTYALIAVHGVTILSGIACVYVHVSRTVWFDGGLFGEIFLVVRGTIASWFLHLAMCVLPWVYRRFLYKGDGTPWSTMPYIALVVVEQFAAVVYWASVLYVIFRVSDRHLYPPYHRMRWTQKVATSMMHMDMSAVQQQQQQHPHF